MVELNRYVCASLLQVIPEETPPAGRKEPAEQREWQEKAAPARHKEEWGSRDAEGAIEPEPDRAGVAASESLGEDFDRTPSGRVRRRSAQVAVFHLQEIAEDELARDWGTKRRIKDDLVPDSKRVSGAAADVPHHDAHTWYFRRWLSGQTAGGAFKGPAATWPPFEHQNKHRRNTSTH